MMATSLLVAVAVGGALVGGSYLVTQDRHY